MSESCILTDENLLPLKYIAEDEIPRYCGPWPEFAATMTICVDSFDGGLANGRLHNYYFEKETCFSSLDQLLFGMEEIMNRADMPQRYEEMRTLLVPAKKGQKKGTKASSKAAKRPGVRRPAHTPQTFLVKQGTLANFFVRVCYRQHSSMQGYLSWVEGECDPVYFRSEMELLALIREVLCIQGTKDVSDT